MSGTRELYADVARKLRDITQLEGINGLLGWDELVMLPSSSAECRGEQKAVLAAITYDKKTEPGLGQLLESLRQKTGELTAVENAVVRDASKQYRRDSAIPKELAVRCAKLESEAYEKWVAARSTNNWALFEPCLSEWVEISKQKAKFIDPENPNAYDVLLDAFEKGMTSKRIDEIFGALREGLVPLIAEIKARGTPPNAAWLTGAGIKYDLDQQSLLCNQIAVDLGFDLTKGRLDRSVHPFTGGAHPTDVRMTTRFKEDDLTEGLTGAIHETGHALYEQGRNLDEEWKDLPVNVALSMGIHESQSLLWERMIALGKPFQHYLLPRIRQHFPSFPAEATPELLYEAQNTLRDPSLIRVEADELTYGLHVVLRYEIERGLIDGSIKVCDVPRLWNEKMQSYLGVTPPSDAQGCLQDVHWSGGAIGYFPTYTLGAMAAAQLYAHYEAHVGPSAAQQQLSSGDFSPLRLWLLEEVHRRGSLPASGDELLQLVTGKPLDPNVYLSYLSTKYRELYKL